MVDVRRRRILGLARCALRSGHVITIMSGPRFLVPDSGG
jgi:hypothetical protein